MDQNSVKEFSGMIDRGNPKRVAVVLAGGDGTRLRSLTRAITGDERPKQFCPILNDRTLLDETRSRIALSIRPEDTYFSLTQKHEAFYERPLWNVPETKMVVQPENMGTAPAILYSLMRIAKNSPDATVAFFPSDHHFTDDEAFMRSVDTAFDAIKINADSVVLLGIEPDKAEPSYGWIEPVDSLFGSLNRSVSRVNRFWEKPAAGVAKRLMSMGCLWNSFVMIGRVDTFLAMFKQHLPEMFRMFSAARTAFGTRMEVAVTRAIYSWIGATNFSSQVLEKSAERLLVVRVGDVGWSDWGEPQRVLRSLSSLGVRPQWMQALAA